MNVTVRITQNSVLKNSDYVSLVVIIIGLELDVKVHSILHIYNTTSSMFDDHDGCEWVKFLLVPAHLGNPGQRAIKWLCACVCQHVLLSLL